MNWKDLMFRRNAAAFSQILAARPLTIDVPGLRSALPREGQKVAVLDLGCGTGRLLSGLASMSTVVVGLDYSPELLEEASKVSRGLFGCVLVRGDMRCLRDLFPRECFSLVVRAYTSLGYFERSVERDVLRQCHEVSTSGGILVMDTFNADWFEQNKNIVRQSDLGEITLLESYDWCEQTRKVACRWTYETERDRTEIQFELDGYTLEEVDAALEATGWRRERLVGGLNDFSPLTSTVTATERLVVIARRE